MGEGDADALEDRCRLDKWLWCTRFYKTRSLAAQAVAGGKAHLNAARVKPAHAVKPGDQVSIVLGGVVADFTVVSLPSRRGPAPEAQRHYRETEPSRRRREQFREQHRLAELSRPRSDVRPDKRERRELRRLQRSQ
ncbi:MAG: RNA-binding S4 domain-containing protein [Proteobacteria bacterium]|nr:RNA-binding S4 domain-containing protein [Pseudomonadota bacterium]